MIRVALLFALISNQAFAGPASIVRVQGKIFGFNKRQVTVKTATGYQITVARDAFPRWAHFEPGAKVSVQMPRIMVLRAQKVN